MTSKVIVTGAYCTGKTTHAQDLQVALADRGHSCVLLPDVARQCPLPLNADQTEATSLWLFGNQVAAEIGAHFARPDFVLCDRGIPDIMTHHADLEARCTDGPVGLLLPFFDYWLSTYDLILFSRVDETLLIEADGIRDTDASYRTRLDSLAAASLTGRSNVVLLPSRRGERLEVSLQAISRLSRR